MLEDLCVETVTSRADCSASGLDGTWYYLQASGGGRAQQAMTWSPRAGSTADVVLDVFFALRAYAGAPPSLEISAYQTLSAKTYTAHHRLGLSERVMRDAAR